MRHLFCAIVGLAAGAAAAGCGSASGGCYEGTWKSLGNPTACGAGCTHWAFMRIQGGTVDTTTADLCTLQASGEQALYGMNLYPDSYQVDGSSLLIGRNQDRATFNCGGDTLLVAGVDYHWLSGDWVRADPEEERVIEALFALRCPDGWSCFDAGGSSYPPEPCQQDSDCRYSNCIAPTCNLVWC
jgi:hypothetical protein